MCIRSGIAVPWVRVRNSHTLGNTMFSFRERISCASYIVPKGQHQGVLRYLCKRILDRSSFNHHLSSIRSNIFSSRRAICSSEYAMRSITSGSFIQPSPLRLKLQLPQIVGQSSSLIQQLLRQLCVCPFLRECHADLGEYLSGRLTFCRSFLERSSRSISCFYSLSVSVCTRYTPVLSSSSSRLPSSITSHMLGHVCVTLTGFIQSAPAWAVVAQILPP